MCAIAGILSPNGRPVDPGMLQRMIEVQAHRGPDGEGYVLLSLAGRERPFAVRGRITGAHGLAGHRYCLGLGHRRLAIVDTSAAGHQPMSTADQRYWVTYNGEIYNYLELRAELAGLGHVFQSQSDTAVLLAAYREWGLSSLSRFNGMFSFAIWDAERRRLLCARDRLGVKPFYYLWDGSLFVFASEIKALLVGQPERTANQKAIFRYLDEGCLDDGAETFFQDVQQLLPGHLLVLEDGKLHIERYWDLPDEGSGRIGSPQKASEELGALLRDAVRIRLRSDVPVGSCLSGGLDSSALVCLADQLLREDTSLADHPVRVRQETFSSCFQDPRYDERQFINLVVDATGVEPHYAFPDPKELAAALPRLVWHQDEPFGSTSIFAQWMVMQDAAQHGVKVLLDGQGADELLAGYHGFFGARFADLIAGCRWKTLVREWLAYRRLHGAMPPQIAANFVRAFVPAPLVRRLRSRIVGGAAWIDKNFLRVQSENEAHATSASTHVRSMQRRLLFSNGLRALLHCEDRNSMAFGIEARLPFLDYRMVEFLYRLSDEEKLRDGWTKFALRTALEGVVPRQIQWRIDKLGFVTPEDHWFRTDLKEFASDILSDARTRERGYLNVDAAKREFGHHVAGRKSLGFVLWRWLNLELWCRQFLDRDATHLCFVQQH